MITLQGRSYYQYYYNTTIKYIDDGMEKYIDNHNHNKIHKR